ncbi:MAG: ABC transporter ATP-binding protein [Bacillota bacterium]
MEKAMDLEIRHICKSFGATRVLRNICLTVPQGKITCLLGPSGCGKTTLLRIITGFLTLDSGQILLGGEDITHIAPNRREIGMVYQNYALFTQMTVFDNVAFGLRVRKLRRDDIAAKVREMLEKVQLAGYEDRYPGQLSGGQQQRVALARALVLHPKILLLDEPLSNLDAKLRVEVRRELHAIQRLFGVTTILVTHDQEEALDISDCIAVMNRGEVEHFGTPLQVYNEPKTKFTMEFVGDVNLFEGVVEDAAAGGKNCAVRCGGLGDIACLPGGIRPGSRVVAGIRPEQVTLQPLNRREPGTVNRFSGSVLDVSFVGPNIRYKAVLDGTGAAVVAIVQNRMNDAAAPMFAAGERVIISWDPKATMLVEQEERGDAT